jgi:16S rRNA processing protein RimM
VAHAERVHLGYLVSLRGVADRDAAEVLRGSEALIARDELPALQGDQIWAADLVGMQVRDEAGAVRGEVVGLELAGPNDLLQVKAAAGVALVPMGLVREVDEEGRTIVIEAPEGLFDVS